MTHTQFLKRAVGCNFHSSNIMTRGELGVRPLITDVNIRVTTYIKNILERQDATVYSALEFERDNEVEPNYLRYANKFNATADDVIFTKPKRKIKIMFQNDYDRYWKVKMMESPKAISYCKFKHTASLEKYMYTIKNVRQNCLNVPQTIEPQSSYGNRKALETKIAMTREKMLYMYWWNWKWTSLCCKMSLVFKWEKRII